MNLERLYSSLISRAQTRDLEGYKERHHIVPKELGGSNDLNLGTPDLFLRS